MSRNKTFAILTAIITLSCQTTQETKRELPRPSELCKKGSSEEVVYNIKRYLTYSPKIKRKLVNFLKSPRGKECHTSIEKDFERQLEGKRKGYRVSDGTLAMAMLGSSLNIKHSGDVLRLLLQENPENDLIWEQVKANNPKQYDIALKQTAKNYSLTMRKKYDLFPINNVDMMKQKLSRDVVVRRSFPPILLERYATAFSEQKLNHEELQDLNIILLNVLAHPGMSLSPKLQTLLQNNVKSWISTLNQEQSVVVLQLLKTVAQSTNPEAISFLLQVSQNHIDQRMRQHAENALKSL